MMEPVPVFLAGVWGKVRDRGFEKMTCLEADSHVAEAEHN